MNNQNKKIAILYHAECPDGFGAAWAAWKKFGDEAIYIPIHHNTLPPEEIYDKEVYLLDYSFTAETTKDLLLKVKSLILIDHHITAREPMELIKKGILKMENSGAVLSWQYFHPNKSVPLLLKYVEDIDIWKLELSKTHEIGEFIGLLDFDFKIWSMVVDKFETKEGFQDYLKQGEVLLKKLKKTTQNVIKNAETVNFEEYECLMANSGYASHVGNSLVQKMPPISLVWSRKKNRVIFSLRSDGTVDVSKLAQKYGGGGHKAAAGFSWENDNFFKFEDHKIS